MPAINGLSITGIISGSEKVPVPGVVILGIPPEKYLGFDAMLISKVSVQINNPL